MWRRPRPHIEAAPRDVPPHRLVRSSRAFALVEGWRRPHIRSTFEGRREAPLGARGPFKLSTQAPDGGEERPAHPFDTRCAGPCAEPV